MPTRTSSPYPPSVRILHRPRGSMSLLWPAFPACCLKIFYHESRSPPYGSSAGVISSTHVSNRCFFFRPKCLDPQDHSWLDVVRCAALNDRPEDKRPRLWWSDGFGCNFLRQSNGEDVDSLHSDLLFNGEKWDRWFMPPLIENWSLCMCVGERERGRSKWGQSATFGTSSRWKLFHHHHFSFPPSPLELLSVCVSTLNDPDRQMCAKHANIHHMHLLKQTEGDE